MLSLKMEVLKPQRLVWTSDLSIHGLKALFQLSYYMFQQPMDGGQPYV